MNNENKQSEQLLPKVQEYIERVNTVESLEEKEKVIQSLGDSSSDWIKQIRENTIDKIPKNQEVEIDLSDMPMIPTNLESLMDDIETLEDMWTLTEYVDESINAKMKAWKKRGMAYARAQEKEKLQKELFKERQKKDLQKEEELRAGLNLEPQYENIESFTINENNLQLAESHEPRIHDIEVIGDLNGSYQSAIDHLLYKKVITVDQSTGAIIWTGGDKNVVLVGDILGDRSPEGMKTYVMLHGLKNQAQLQGGDVDYLSGNHENMFNSVLAGFEQVEGGVTPSMDLVKRSGNYPGNLETFVFLPDSSKLEFIDSLKKEMYLKQEAISQIILKAPQRISMMKSASATADAVNQYEQSIEKRKLSLIKIKKFLEEKPTDEDVIDILSIWIQSNGYNPKLSEIINDNIIEVRNTMRSDAYGQEVLFALCEQKICSLSEDVLIVHTNFTYKMAKIIESFSNDGSYKTGVKNLNNFYKKILSAHLLDNPMLTTITRQELDYFKILQNEFLSTSAESRVNFTEGGGGYGMKNKISQQEVNDMELFLKKMGVNAIIHGHSDEGGTIKGTPDLPILSIDRSVYKNEGAEVNVPMSFASIGKNGTINFAA